MSGNGASATVLVMPTDMTKQAKVKSMCLTDPSLITAYGNDYG